VEIRVEGLDKALGDFGRLKVSASNAARRTVERGAVTVASNAKREFRARPKGSVRTSQKTGKKWYDSRPPFEPQKPSPTNRSGNLRDGIKMLSIAPVGTGRWMSVTGPTAMYGARVESLGYLYMKPGLDKSIEAIRMIYEQEMARATK
jgi:hypothetical protein